MYLILEASGFGYRTSTGQGKQTLGRHRHNLMCTRAQEQGAVRPRERPVSVQESLLEACVDSGLPWLQDH